jgi:hypothetical protein
MKRVITIALAITFALTLLASCADDKSFNLVGKWHTDDDSSWSPVDIVITDVYKISGSAWEGAWEYEIIGETKEGFVLVTKLYRDQAYADEQKEKYGAISSPGWQKNTYDVSIIDKDHFKYTHIETGSNLSYDLDVVYERVK